MKLFELLRGKTAENVDRPAAPVGRRGNGSNWRATATRRPGSAGNEDLDEREAAFGSKASPHATPHATSCPREDAIRPTQRPAHPAVCDGGRHQARGFCVPRVTAGGRSVEACAAGRRGADATRPLCIRTNLLNDGEVRGPCRAIVWWKKGRRPARARPCAMPGPLSSTETRHDRDAGSTCPDW